MTSQFHVCLMISNYLLNDIWKIIIKSGIFMYTWSTFWWYTLVYERCVLILFWRVALRSINRMLFVTNDCWTVLFIRLPFSLKLVYCVTCSIDGTCNFVHPVRWNGSSKLKFSSASYSLTGIRRGAYVCSFVEAALVYWNSLSDDVFASWDSDSCKPSVPNFILSNYHC